MDFSRQCKDIEYELVIPDLQHRLTAAPFAALQDLRLAQNASVTAAIVTVITGPLQYLACSIYSAIRIEEVRHLVKTIATVHATLKTVKLYLLDVGPADPADNKIGRWQHLAPLLQCRHLMSMSIRYRQSISAFDFTDADLLSIATKLPCLRHLCLRWEKKTRPGRDLICGLLDERAVTLSGLIMALHHQPRLNHIHLTSVNSDDIQCASGAIVAVTRSVRISADSFCMPSPFIMVLFLSRWLPNCKIAPEAEDDDTTSFLPEHEDARNIIIIMSMLEFIRCYNRLVDCPESFEELRTPEVMKTLERIMQAKI